jgi:hypothetical protein
MEDHTGPHTASPSPRCAQGDKKCTSESVNSPFAPPGRGPDRMSGVRGLARVREGQVRGSAGRPAEFAGIPKDLRTPQNGMFSSPSPGPPLSRGGNVRQRLAKIDWRGWITLVWVLWFGWLYSLMVLETKFPQVLAWVREAMAVSTGGP